MVPGAKAVPSLTCIDVKPADCGTIFHVTNRLPNSLSVRGLKTRHYQLKRKTIDGRHVDSCRPSQLLRLVHLPLSLKSSCSTKVIEFKINPTLMNDHAPSPIISDVSTGLKSKYQVCQREICRLSKKTVFTVKIYSF